MTARIRAPACRAILRVSRCSFSAVVTPFAGPVPPRNRVVERSSDRVARRQLDTDVRRRMSRTAARRRVAMYRDRPGCRRRGSAVARSCCGTMAVRFRIPCFPAIRTDGEPHVVTRFQVPSRPARNGQRDPVRRALRGNAISPRATRTARRLRRGFAASIAAHPAAARMAIDGRARAGGDARSP